MFDFADDLVQPWRRSSLPAIVAKRIRQCKAMRGREADRSHANQSRTNAMAAGAAWTNKILRLTVAAP